MEPIEVTIPGPAASYCSLLDEALKKADDGPQKSYYPLRPSAAGYCARKLAYQLAVHRGRATPAPDPKKPSVMRLLDLGHSIEWHALKQFSKYLPELEQRFKQQVVDIFTLDSGTRIEGSTDAAFVAHKALVDVKSVGPRWSRTYKSTWDEMLDKYSNMSTVIQFDENAFYVHDVRAFFEEVGEDALVANITQLNLYLCSDFMHKRGMDHGVIYRYNKADSRHMEIRFAPSFDLFSDIKEKFNRIEQANQPEDVPRGALLGSQACAFCPFAPRCWPDVADPKKEYFGTLPKKSWATRATAELEDLFSKLDVATRGQAEGERLTTQILTCMENAELRKIKLTDGRVYEKVMLKSPRPHYELRRSKE